MANGKKNSRKYLTIGAIIIALAMLAIAFWPSAIAVDMDEVTSGPMQLSIDEEGRTQVHDAFLVSAPSNGRLQRIEVEAGDAVTAGSVIGWISPPPLDSRSEAQARANIASAQAALRAAQSERDNAAASKELADADLAREERLWALESTSRSALELAQRNAQGAASALEASNAAIALRQADLASARAQINASSSAIPIRAPVSGQVLSVRQESEATVAVGTPIVEIGNIAGDLEVVVELLSTDAVQVSMGDPVVIEDWGGDVPITGEVAQIDPQGFTKVSALGVEEQRVNARIRINDPADRLGSGFRVEARITIWQNDNTLIVPSTALFREQGEWAVFVVSGGKAELRQLEIGRNNGTQAQVLSGLQEGETVILYPASEVEDGSAVEQREVG
ncbi:MAG: efflux RND transporter periplasmic adaptor subunit [Erythrobacter sp.]|jgi:HlyD family secretion protein|nr:efflux RND transporter periplasmic adaptor subunit [Erythrobacter sp.]